MLRDPRLAKGVYLNDRDVHLFSSTTQQTLDILKEHLCDVGGPHQEPDKCMNAFRDELRELLQNFDAINPRAMSEITLIWRLDLGVFQVLNGRHRLAVLHCLVQSGCRCLLSPEWPQTLAELLEKRLTFTILCNKDGDLEIRKKGKPSEPAVSLYNAGCWIVGNSLKENANVKRSEEALRRVKSQQLCVLFYDKLKEGQIKSWKSSTLVVNSKDRLWMCVLPAPTSKDVLKSINDLDDVTIPRYLCLLSDKNASTPLLKSLEALTRMASSALLSSGEYENLPNGSKMSISKNHYVDLALALETASDFMSSLTSDKDSNLFLNQLGLFRALIPLGVQLVMSVSSLTAKLSSCKELARHSALPFSKHEKAQFVLANFLCKEHVIAVEPALFQTLGKWLKPLPANLDTPEPWFAFLGLRLTVGKIGDLIAACLRFKEAVNFVHAQRDQESKERALVDWICLSLDHLVEADKEKFPKMFPSLYTAIQHLQERYRPQQKEASASAQVEEAVAEAAVYTPPSKTGTETNVLQERMTKARLLESLLDVQSKTMDKEAKSLLGKLVDQTKKELEQPLESGEKKSAPIVNKKRTKKTKETKVELVQLPIGAAIVTNDSFSSGRCVSIDSELLANTGLSYILWAPKIPTDETETSALANAMLYHSLEERDCFVGILLEFETRLVQKLGDFLNRAREIVTATWASQDSSGNNTVSCAYVHSWGTQVANSSFLLTLYRCTVTIGNAAYPNFVPDPSTLQISLEMSVPPAQHMRERLVDFFATQFLPLSSAEAVKGKDNIHGLVAVIAPSICYSSHYLQEESSFVLSQRLDEGRYLFYGAASSSAYTPPGWMAAEDAIEESEPPGVAASSSTPQHQSAPSRQSPKSNSGRFRSPRGRGAGISASAKEPRKKKLKKGKKTTKVQSEEEGEEVVEEEGQLEDMEEGDEDADGEKEEDQQEEEKKDGRSSLESDNEDDSDFE